MANYGGDKVVDNDIIDLHGCKNQVIITQIAPSGLKISLDILPCFQVSEEHEEEINQLRVRFPNHKALQTIDHNHRGGWIAASSNGVLLCTTGRLIQSRYYLCDPITKDWLPVPPAPRTHLAVHIGFVFHRCTGTHHQDADLHNPLRCTTCRFLLVRFDENHNCFHQHQSVFQVETFSSETGQWTTDTVTTSGDKKLLWAADFQSFRSIFHNGCFHWYTCSKMIVYDPDRRKFLGVIQTPWAN